MDTEPVTIQAMLLDIEDLTNQTEPYKRHCSWLRMQLEFCAFRCKLALVVLGDVPDFIKETREMVEAADGH